MVSGLVRLTSNNRNITYSRSGGAIVLNMKKPSGSSAAEKVDALLAELLSLFRQAGAVPACFECGAPAPEGFALVNGSAITYLGFGSLFVAAGFLSLMRVTKFQSKAKAGKFKRL